ncbi:hypothetical protein [Alkalicoccus chagannorensis]|uniref:hypothetical protein n=1 Tax=Alkalicoccus chagannorensis TaxID=427072 RepID=UPI000685FA95|nr:hypothetical protein [Alkalicoccus chagannorensis]
MRLLSLTAYITAAVYLLPQPFPLLAGIGSMFLLAAAYPKINPSSRIVLGILLLLSAWLYIQAGASPSDVLMGFASNADLLGLFLFIPIVGMFMTFSGYLASLQQVIKRRAAVKGNHPYRLSFLLMTGVGFILNFGTMAIIKQTASESFKSFHEKRLMIHTMRGFACCMLWSPYFVNVGLVLSIYDASWFNIAGWGLTAALLYGMLAVIWLPKTKPPYDRLVEAPEAPPETKAELLPLLRYIVIFIILSMAAYIVLPLNMLAVVTVLGGVFPFLYAALRRETAPFFQHVKKEGSGVFGRMKNELAVFVTAGVFGTAVQISGTGAQLSLYLEQWTFGSVTVFTAAVLGSTILLAVIGIHPIIVIVGIGSALTPETFGVTPVYLSMLLLCSWTLATQVSPFSGQVLLASRLGNMKPVRLVKENAGFTAAGAVLLCSFLLAGHHSGLM